MKKDSSASTISDRIFHQPIKARISRSTNSVNSNQTTCEQPNQDDQDGETNNKPPLPIDSRVFHSRNSLNNFLTSNISSKSQKSDDKRLLNFSFNGGGGNCKPNNYGALDRIERGANNNGKDDQDQKAANIAVSDIIGSFGWFQFLVLFFSGLRECMVGYDALIMSVILQPESNFICADNLSHNQFEQLNQHVNHSSTTNLGANLTSQLFNGVMKHEWNETEQCFRFDYLMNEDSGGQTMRQLFDSKQRPVECQNWLFPNNNDEGVPSLVAQWSLVCQNHWLVAFIESAYFFGLVSGNLVWGYTADRLGRRPAYLAAHCISLVFGSLAVVMPSIWLFAVCRYLSAFGAIGYNIIYSIQVELIGVKHRSFSTILNHLGWGLGVIMVPFVDRLFDDYRPILAVSPILSLIMFPWAFWLPESSRWLMANGRFSQAKDELIRAARFNGKGLTPRLEKRISLLEQKQRQDKLNQQEEISSNGGGGRDKRSYNLIFTNKTLVKDTVILSYLAFTGHLFYYVLTINFAYMKNLSTEANFIISGAGEWVSVIVGAILLKFCSRKACMSLFLLLMTSSFLFQSLIDSELAPSLDTSTIITANNGIGTLSSLLLIFIVLIVNQEVYPTVVRQTGTSLTNTVGESGSTLAPLLIQFSRLIGPWRANIFYSFISTVGILAVQFVTKTDDIELPDT